MHLLFVCTGNICRSPTAERLTLAYADQLPEPDQLTASSVGTRAVVGSAMHPEAESVLSGLGGSALGFRARQISPEIVAEADIVVAMTDLHRTSVLNASPRHLNRTFTLLEARVLAEAVPPGDLVDTTDLTVRGQELTRAMVGQRPRRRTDEAWDDDIVDPIGSDAAVFTEVGDQIAAALTAWLDVLTGRRDQR